MTDCLSAMRKNYVKLYSSHLGFAFFFCRNLSGATLMLHCGFCANDWRVARCRTAVRLSGLGLCEGPCTLARRIRRNPDGTEIDLGGFNVAHRWSGRLCGHIQHWFEEKLEAGHNGYWGNPSLSNNRPEWSSSRVPELFTEFRAFFRIWFFSQVTLIKTDVLIQESTDVPEFFYFWSFRLPIWAQCNHLYLKALIFFVFY